MVCGNALAHSNVHMVGAQKNGMGPDVPLLSLWLKVVVAWHQ